MATQGTWGPQTGFWGALNPFSRDYNMTERLSGGAGGTTFNNPNRSTGITTNPNSFGLDTQSFTMPGVSAGTTLDLNNPANRGIRGQTLGASTGGGQVPSLPNTPQGPNPQDAVNQQQNQLRGEISGNWDNYLSSLDSQLFGIGEQRTAQEGIAGSQFNQGVNTMDLQRTQGMDQLGNQRTQAGQNQARNLRDVGSNLKNSFMAGNIYLGSKGAGDSSAANQYAYALTKMGSQQRGDIMNNTSNIMSDIAGRETNLTNMYNTEKKNLQEGLNQQTAGIAQWFANAQQQIQMQKSQGMLQKGQDLQSLTRDALNYAMQQLQTIQGDVRQRQSSLDNWAMSNSKTLTDLKTNMQGVSNPSYKLPQAQPITGTPQYTSEGNFYIPSGYGTSNEKQTNIFGQ